MNVAVGPWRGGSLLTKVPRSGARSGISLAPGAGRSSRKARAAVSLAPQDVHVLERLISHLVRISVPRLRGIA